jgi:hypothetical protein
MLERVALHQTRLRTPGLGLDPRGVALGSRGLVLLPGLERLVAFFSLYTRSGSLEDVLPTLEVQVVRSRLGAREVVVSFSADSSDRLDRVSEIARLAGGYTFTGTSRHFVQYRDAGAPFGYDAVELLSGADLEAKGDAGAALLLYHQSFSQAYAVERSVDVRRLLSRLSPHVDPKSHGAPGPKWILAERGLGPALIAYFLRSNVDAEVGVAEWPPASSFDEAPVTRYLFRAGELPPRMLPLLTGTPGLAVFQPVAEGVAVQLGFRHPVELRACPVFPREGLVLFRGHGLDPIELERVPALGAVAGFARVELADEQPGARRSVRVTSAPEVRLPLRLTPSLEPWSRVTATWVRPDELPLLRRLAYVLAPGVLRRATVAFSELGAFVRHPTGIEAIPVGEFFRELCDGLFVPAGYDPLPAVSPEVLHRSLDLPAGQVAFVGRDARVHAIDGAAFVSLETAILESPDWSVVPALEIAPALATEIPELVLESPGLLPMRDLRGEAEG